MEGLRRHLYRGQGVFISWREIWVVGGEEATGVVDLFFSPIGFVSPELATPSVSKASKHTPFATRRQRTHGAPTEQSIEK